MLNIQPITDKFAISLSLACAIHCLVTPILLIALPSLTVLGLDDEAFHKAMVIIVVPTSVLSLFIGCKKHKHYQLYFYSFTGLALLILALFLHDTFMGEYGEKIATLIGAGLIAYSHYRNFRLCNVHENCQHHSNNG